MLADQLEVKQDRIEVKDANEEAFISARTSRGRAARSAPRRPQRQRDAGG
jgi:hypothetical protein